MATRLSDLVAALDAGGYKPKNKGSGEWEAKCPVHGGDDWDSLNFREAEDGELLVHCQSRGCSFLDVLDVLDLRSASDRHEEPGPQSAGSLTLVASYDYVNENGELLFQVQRYCDQNGRKTFRQRRMTPDGWVWSIKGVRRVLYRLPEVNQAIADGRTVWLVEGEKDVHTLEQLGLVGTCNAGGACSKPQSWHDEYTSTLTGAKLVVIPDNDDAGRRHADVVIGALAGKAASITRVELPGLPSGGDLTDWVGAGGTVGELRDLTLESDHLRPISMLDFMQLPIEPRPWVIEPILKAGDLALIHSWRGCGKTQLAVGVSLMVASGGSLMHWSAPEPRGVLYVEGEMSPDEMQARLRKQGAGIPVPDGGLESMVSNLRFIQHDVVARRGYRMKSMSDPAGMAELETSIRNAVEYADPPIRLLVLDNLSCLHGGDENDSTTFSEFRAFLIRMRRLGITTLVIHHSGKAGTSRGHSTLEDQLDVVLKLDKKKYSSAEGAKFDVRFEKARGLTGEAASGFTAALVDNDRGDVAQWHLVREEKAIPKEKIDGMQRVAALLDAGVSQRDIARELNISRTTVQRYVRDIKGR